MMKSRYHRKIICIALNVVLGHIYRLHFDLIYFVCDILAGSVTTLAGFYSGFADGMGSNAQFYNPSAVAVDVLGMVYVADTNNYLIRLVTSSGDGNTNTIYSQSSILQ